MSAAATLVVVLAGCGGDGDDGPTPTTEATTTTSTTEATTTTSTTTTTLPTDAVEVIPTTIAANSAVFAGGSLWVSGTEVADQTGSDTLLRLDPATTEVVSRIDVGSAPHVIVPVGDVLWVGVVDGVARVDMTTEAVDIVPAEGVVRDLAATESAVWFHSDAPSRVDLMAIDPETLEVRDLNLSDSTASIGAGALAAEGDTVWISASGLVEKGVIAVDATTDAAIDTFTDEFETAGLVPAELFVLDGELWGCAVDLTCLVVDAETGEVGREVVLGTTEDGERPRELRDLVAAEGSLWLGRTDGQENPDSQYDTSTVVERFDPATGALLGRVYETASPPRRVAVGEGAVILLSSANETREPREIVRITLG